MSNPSQPNSQPEFRITIDGVWAASSLLDSASLAKQLEDYLGETPRIECANRAATEWRETIIFDDTGIYLLRDKASGYCVSATFVWQPDTVPYPPRKSYCGRIHLNGCWLTKDANLTNIPADGPIGLAKFHGNRLTGAFSTFHVSLKFKKQPNPSGRQAQLRPAYLEFGYSERDMPKEVILKRLRKN